MQPERNRDLHQALSTSNVHDTNDLLVMWSLSKAVGSLRDAQADLAFVGGTIRTPAHPSGFVQALAARGGVIQALGTDADIRDLTGPGTRVVDLRGRLALPAFGDAHVHPVGGGLESLRCNLLGLKTRPEYLEVISAYCATLLPGSWVLGGGWTMAAFPGGMPVAADLDAVTGGRPAFLPNRDHHSAWVNTAALTIAGVDAGTPDPQDGRIERDEAGRPVGALHDGAMRLVAARVPPVSAAELTEGLLTAQSYLHSLGITRWQDACVGAAAELGLPDAFDAYCRAADGGLLTGHAVGALWWDRHRGLDQIDDLLARRERAEAGDGRFRATTVKLMVDGVCETFTAAMSAPYLDGHGHPSGHRGNLFIEPEVLAEATRRLAAAGFQLHFHAIGDRAVTVALDALEALPAARRQAARHHLAHLQFIAPRDLGRFRAVDAVANFQPLWACAPPQMTEFTVPFVGAERSSWQYLIGSLARGARGSRSGATGRCRAPTRSRRSTSP
jgi:predicted amidohydrolase YtcJ